jgi:lipoate-protein ligase A
MINNTRIIRTNTNNPWWNLSVEEYLLDRVEPGQCILYLWQNENTVVIGRNQNPWRECKTEQFESEGGKLARRLSGGGAVYHDLGNLNFTFVVSRELYDLEKQVRVILNAVNSLGLKAEMSGRNDLTADGRKFSGNAFCFRKSGAYHHGTVLVNTNFEKLSNYLQVSQEKIKSKGIQSVQARVVNLAELQPALTVDAVADALIDSFRSAYHSDAPVEDAIRDGKTGRASLEELYCKYSSWCWRYGEAPKFDIELETRFPWGGVQIGFKLENGLVREASVYSDAMDEEFISRLPGVFKGCAFSSQQLAQRVFDISDETVCKVTGDAVCRAEKDAADNAADLAKAAMTVDIAGWLEGKGF